MKKDYLEPFLASWCVYVCTLVSAFELTVCVYHLLGQISVSFAAKSPITFTNYAIILSASCLVISR